LSSEPSNFSLILDSLNVSGELPFEIIPQHWFRKVEKQEVELIKTKLSAHEMAYVRYEYGLTMIGDDLEERPHLLPPDSWRYYVISFHGSSENLRNIQHAANLLKDDLNLGWTFHNDNAGSGAISYLLADISTFFVDHPFFYESPKSLGIDELREITSNYNLITGLDKNLYPNVLKAVSEFHQTKIIPNMSVLKILSYFSIIESLLTHRPKPSDTIDSITRQITTKMLLLNKRFQREMQYKSYFPTVTNLETVWKRLYDFRSRLSHGDNTDFTHEFSALESTDKISIFLIESLKLLILYTLNEPEFLADLQKC